MLRVGLAALPVAFKVHAAEPTEPLRGRLVKPKDLPIYGEPEPPAFTYVEEKVGPFRQSISSVRSSVWDFVNTAEDTSDKAKSAIGVVRDYAKDLLHYIQVDSGVVPRAVIITVSGLGGIVAGYRGGNIRRAIYAMTGMVSAAAICYPHQAVDISRYGWYRTTGLVKERVLGYPESTKPELHKELFKVEKPSWIKPKSDTSSSVTKQVSKAETSTVAESVPIIEEVKKPVDEKRQQSEKPSGKSVDVEGDYGQSSPQDKDLYTTRDG